MSTKRFNWSGISAANVNIGGEQIVNGDFIVNGNSVDGNAFILWRKRNAESRFSEIFRSNSLSNVWDYIEENYNITIYIKPSEFKRLYPQGYDVEHPSGDEISLKNGDELRITFEPLGNSNSVNVTGFGNSIGVISQNGGNTMVMNQNGMVMTDGNGNTLFMNNNQRPSERDTLISRLESLSGNVFVSSSKFLQLVAVIGANNLRPYLNFSASSREFIISIVRLASDEQLNALYGALTTQSWE